MAPGVSDGHIWLKARFRLFQALRGGPTDRGFDSFFGIHSSPDVSPLYYIRGIGRLPDQRKKPTGEVASGGESLTVTGLKVPGFVQEEVSRRFVGRRLRLFVSMRHRGKPSRYLSTTPRHSSSALSTQCGVQGKKQDG